LKRYQNFKTIGSKYKYVKGTIWGGGREEGRKITDTSVLALGLSFVL
jgi:hypothetical protein